MATPYQITGAYAGQGGAFGPVEYGGALFVVALSALATASSEHSVLSIFKSTDAGATWTQVGSDITLPSSDDSTGSNIPVGDSEVFHGCVDINFPTSPYGYVIHADADHKLIVSRVNYNTEDWDDTSAAGPDIQDPSETGNHNSLGWMIEQASDGEFGILANLNTAGSDTDRVYAMSLSSDLGTWSSRAQVSGQSGGIYYAATGIARGTSGRVHGWIEAEDSQFDMYHTMVIGGGGGVGSALELVAEGQRIFRTNYTGAHDEAGNIAFLFVEPAVGVGTNFKLSAAHAVSADPPTFTIVDVDPATSGTNSYWGSIAAGSTLRAAWNASNSFDNILHSSYSGAWSAAAEGVDGIAPFYIEARQIAAGLGVTFGQEISAVNTLWYVLITAGGTVQAIVGIEPIPSGEKLHRTHGVTGGGLETCGTPVPVVADNTCNPVDPDLAVDAPSICVPQGYSY